MTACDDKRLLLQAYIDGELDAANTVALEAHIRSCMACAEQLNRLEAVRRMLVDADLSDTASAALRSRIEMQLAPPLRPGAPRFGFANPRVFPTARSWGSGLVTGLLFSLALMFVLPQFTRLGTEDQLVANHIRSLSLNNHLTDIATSNRHVVKPWFNGKIAFAPPVPELAVRGFPLVGGRLDYVDGHEIAAIVYKRRLHTINVFVQPAGRLSLPVGIATRHDGYSLLRWTGGGLEFWAVSDIDLGELQLFRRAFMSDPNL